MTIRIACLPGDGIGPEVCFAAMNVLRTAGERFGHDIELTEYLIGGAAIDAHESPLPPGTLTACQSADAVLLGAVGGPKWDRPDGPRPEGGLLELRRAMGLYANLRPIRPHPHMIAYSPLKPEVLEGVDMIILRELTGGLYFGKKHRDQNSATDTCTYTRREIVRIVRRAGTLARSRRGKVTSVDKFNVLETSRLWRQVAGEILEAEFPDVEVEHLLVDAAAMHLLSRPASFDVIVTENMFGDILTDEASMLAGSMGLLPSASLGEGQRGLYEPIHGSAPDIAGKGIANPIGAILSAALLLRYSLALETEAQAVEAAVSHCLAGGCTTADVGGANSTLEVTREITKRLAQN